MFVLPLHFSFFGGDFDFLKFFYKKKYCSIDDKQRGVTFANLEKLLKYFVKQYTGK